MTELLFYHLQGGSLNAVLPALIEKSVERGWRVAVQTSSQERLEALDQHLWTYRDDSFLAHGTDRDREPAVHPVLLTVSSENRNAAQVRFLIDGAPMPFDAPSYLRIVLVFDGEDAEALAAARQHLTDAKHQSFEVTYWQVEAEGRWHRKA
jgi:DNA polymerase III subunit chi